MPRVRSEPLSCREPNHTRALAPGLLGFPPHITLPAVHASSRVHLHIVHGPRGLTAGPARRGLKRAAEADVDGTVRGAMGRERAQGHEVVYHCVRLFRCANVEGVVGARRERNTWRCAARSPSRGYAPAARASARRTGPRRRCPRARRSGRATHARRPPSRRRAHLHGGAGGMGWCTVARG